MLLLARIIAGEAAGCPFEAKIAVAHVYENRMEAGIEGGWFGDAEPTTDDWLAVQWYTSFPDPTDGALYMIAETDRLKMPWLKTLKTRWQCSDGRYIEAWN